MCKTLCVFLEHPVNKLIYLFQNSYKSSHSSHHKSSAGQLWFLQCNHTAVMVDIQCSTQIVRRDIMMHRYWIIKCGCPTDYKINIWQPYYKCKWPHSNKPSLLSPPLFAIHSSFFPPLPRRPSFPQREAAQNWLWHILTSAFDMSENVQPRATWL